MLHPMLRPMPYPVRRCLNGLIWALGLSVSAKVWAQAPIPPAGQRFERVPISTPFEPRFMPYDTLPPSPTPAASTATSTAASAPASAPVRERMSYTAQDVRHLWRNRRLLSGWLNFEAMNQNLRQNLQAAGRLPTGVEVQALTSNTYAERATGTAQSAQTGSAQLRPLALKTTAGQPITPEAPAPVWVEPLFHQTFIACVPSEQATKPPLSKDVLGARYDTDRRCGLMGDQGQWLLRPEFAFMELVHGDGNQGLTMLLLREQEPCVTTLDLPVRLTCWGQPLSTLFDSDRLAFSAPDPKSKRRGGVFGYVGSDGKWAIAPQFREAQAFSGRIATVNAAGIPAVIDATGKPLTAFPPNDTVVTAWWSAKGKGRSFEASGVINRSGDILIPFVFNIEQQGPNRYQACYEGGCHTLSVPKPTAALPQATPILPPISPQALQAAARLVATGENGRWGYQDANGQWVIQPQFDDLTPFENGLATAQSKGSKGQWGVLLPTGKWLHPAEFSSISPFSQGVAVGTNATTGAALLLHADGKRIDLTTAKATLVSQFDNDGWAIATDPNGKYGYINRFAEWTIPPQYTNATPFSGAYAIVKAPLPPTWQPSTLPKDPPYFLSSTHWLTPHTVALRAQIGPSQRWGLMDKDGYWLVPTQ